jgi:FMN phosphatase YigB (HAD superfamily)
MLPVLSTEPKAILLDLDSTLYDNLKTRHHAISPALALLHLNKSISQSLADYERIVELSETLEQLGYPNFRHVWSCKELYAIITVLCTNSTSHLRSLGIQASDQKKFLSSIEAAHCSYRKITRSKNGRIHRSSALSIQNSTMLTFTACVGRLLNLPILNHAHRAFERTLEFKLNRGVSTFLEKIHTAGIEAYIVTEGYTAIQSNKICRLGLAPHFEKRILTSEDAARPVGWQSLLKKIACLENEKASPTQSSTGREDLKTLKSIARMIIGYENKTNPLFFSRVIHAIVANQTNPYTALRNFAVVSAKTWAKKAPPKFAMIGDRYDKDVLPLMQLVGKKSVLTIRFLHGKHKKSYLLQSIAPPLQPHLTTDSFKKIEKYLLNEETWHTITPIKSPPKLLKLPRKDISRLQQLSPILKTGLIAKIARMTH